MTYFGSLARSRLLITCTITWNWREVIVAAILDELNDNSFKAFTYKRKGIVKSKVIFLSVK
jgi:hypothetical protein